MKKKPSSNQHPTKAQPTTGLTLRVVISNGEPAHDTRLKFEFSPKQAGDAQVWLARLPKLKNADTFAREIAPNLWELRLEAVSETIPLEVLSFSPESAKQWLVDVFNSERKHATELLILARDRHFTVTVTE